MTIDLNSLNIDSSIIELFSMDLNPIGVAAVYRFTPYFADGGTVAFGGSTYTSLPITSEGWEVSANGTQPRPTLTLSNIIKTLENEVILYSDLVGAKVTRYRTLKKYLDGEAFADSNKFLAPDVFDIEQKIAHNKEVIQWQLSSVLDRFGTKLPRRQITRDNFPGVGRQRGGW